MSQKKDDVFELNFDDFNTGLLEKELFDYEDYLDDYKERLEKAQKTFYEYQKNEISKITKEKEKLSKMQSETEKSSKQINKNYNSLKEIVSKFEGTVNKAQK